MSITTRLMTPDDAPGYDRFLAAHPHAMIYYTRAYGDFLSTLLACGAHTLIALDAQEIVGLLPLARCDGPDGAVYNSLPYYGSHGGPLSTSQSAYDALLKHYGDIIAAPGTAAAMIVENPFETGQIKLDAYDCACFRDERIGQMTPLPTEGETALLALLDGSARRNIKKAAKNGVTVAVENDQFDFLRATHIDNMAAMGGNAKSPAFFKAIQASFVADTDYTLHVARHDGQPVAALLTLYGFGAAEYFTPVTVGEARALEPMAAILKDAMLAAAARGMRWWNWGGTWATQDGVYRFKKKWGAQERQYRYSIHVRNRDLLDRTPQELLQNYPGFYVLPFTQLKATP